MWMQIFGKKSTFEIVFSNTWLKIDLFTSCWLDNQILIKVNKFLFLFSGVLFNGMYTCKNIYGPLVQKLNRQEDSMRDSRWISGSQPGRHKRCQWCSQILNYCFLIDVLLQMMPQIVILNQLRVLPSLFYRPEGYHEPKKVEKHWDLC
jgi:hypothetical protein